MRRSLLGSTTGLLCALLLVSAAKGQETPFVQLRAYDYQSRQPVQQIAKLIAEAGTNSAALQKIERALVEVLKHPQTTLAGKQEAARFLGIIGGQLSAPALGGLIGQRDLTDIAVYGLERNPSAEASAVLRRAVARTTGAVRVGIVNAIGVRRDRAAVGLLKGLLRSPEPALVEAAVAALGRIGTPEAVLALKTLPASNAAAGAALVAAARQMAREGGKQQALALLASVVESNRPGVPRGAALETLRELDGARGMALALKSLEARDGYLASVAARIVGASRSPASTSNVLARWRRLSGEVQAVLLAAWAERGERAAGQVVLAAMNSKDPLVRLNAIRAAGPCAGSRAVPRLVETINSSEWLERETALQVLTAMRTADAEGPLELIADRGETRNRVAVMRVLGLRGTARSRALLMRYAADPNGQVAAAALQAVRDLAGEREYPLLVALLAKTEDESVQDAGRETLVAIARRMKDANKAAEPLVSALGQASAPRPALMQALAEIGGDLAIGTLARYATEERGSSEIRQAALQALAEHASDRAALSTLLTLARQASDRSARIQATRGYIRIVGSLERGPLQERVAALREVMPIVERDEERRQVLGVLREFRIAEAVELAAAMLDLASVRDDAAATILHLALPDKDRPNERPAVKGAVVSVALRKVLDVSQDAEIREQARALLSRAG